jgi:hypothetical protein
VLALRIHLPFLAKELNISTQEVESLMADLILDGKIVAQIDQVQQLIRFRESGAQASTRKFAALSKWTTALTSTQAARPPSPPACTNLPLCFLL